MRISSASTEYVRIPVAATKNGATYDPTGDTVQMGFSLAGDTGAPSTWYAATWETSPTGQWAICLIGPAGVTQLDPGTYIPYVKIADSPEIPVIRAQGFVEVY